MLVCSPHSFFSPPPPSQHYAAINERLAVTILKEHRIQSVSARIKRSVHCLCTASDASKASLSDTVYCAKGAERKIPAL